MTENMWKRGYLDAYQDRCENVPFSSTGGIDKRNDMQVPYYVAANDRDEYLKGYKASCADMFGSDWQTCQFGWQKVFTIGEDE